MINVTYEMYAARGFGALNERNFDAYINRAGLYAQARTLGRVEWSFGPPAKRKRRKRGLGNLEERNARGICELADLFYRFEAAVSDNGAAIISYRNEGISETFEGGAREGSGDSFHRRLSGIMRAYFAPEQLSRAVGPC